MRGRGLGKRGWDRRLEKRGWGWRWCARVGGREGCKGEGKVEWGWRKGRGVRERWSGVGGSGVGFEGAESEERRGRTTRIELNIWNQ